MVVLARAAQGRCVVVHLDSEVGVSLFCQVTGNRRTGNYFILIYALLQP